MGSVWVLFLLSAHTLPIIAALWVVYGCYFFFLPIQDLYILHILQAAHIQPVSRLQLPLSNAH